MRQARGREYLVAILGYEIVLAVVQRGHRQVTQHIIERPHQRLRFSALEILLHWPNEYLVQLLCLRDGIGLWLIDGLAEREDFLPQVGGVNRELTRLHRARRNHDDSIFVLADKRIESDRARIQMP